MAENSEISWTTHTFNPWWGCTRVSPACLHCYAETWAKRFDVGWGVQSRRKFFGDKHWNEPLKWDRQAAKSGERPRVFCASMADVFELLPDRHPDAEQLSRERARLWRLIEETPHLDWLLLTKRPENILGMTPGHWDMSRWPAQVWVGTTVENQEQANKRVPELLQIPAAVRFLSMEPLLSPVDLTRIAIEEVPTPEGHKPTHIDCLKGIVRTNWQYGYPAHGIIHLVITGGESGYGARPSHPDWFRSLRDQCQAAGVPFHFKQWGAWQDGSSRDGANRTVLNTGRVLYLPENEATASERANWHKLAPVMMSNVGKKQAGRMLDGRTWDELPAPVVRAAEGVR